MTQELDSSFVRQEEARKLAAQNALPAPDLFFLQLTIALVFIGVLAIASASWYESIHYTGGAWTFLIKHIVAVVIGLTAMFFLSYVNYKWWHKFAWTIAIICLVLLVLTSQFGVITGGSRRWLSLGFFQLQSSEFVKIAAVILMSKVVSQGKFKDLFIALGLVSIMGVMVLKQPDLGTTLLIMSSIPLVAFAAGFNLLLFVGGIGGLGYLVWQQILKTPYQMERIKYWLDPWLEPLGRGYNLIQSQYAIGSGGLWGLGYGASKQKLGFLPISHADFIFSIICEELGFLGTLAVLAVFLAWVLRAMHLSYVVEDNFARYIVFAFAGMIGLQMVINICVSTGLLPTTGMTLPFVSFGGSSFIASSVMAGIILNISRFASAEKLESSD